MECCLTIFSSYPIHWEDTDQKGGKNRITVRGNSLIVTKQSKSAQCIVARFHFLPQEQKVPWYISMQELLLDITPVAHCTLFQLLFLCCWIFPCHLHYCPRSSIIPNRDIQAARKLATTKSYWWDASQNLSAHMSNVKHTWCFLFTASGLWPEWKGASLPNLKNRSQTTSVLHLLNHPMKFNLLPPSLVGKVSMRQGNITLESI